MTRFSRYVPFFVLAIAVLVGLSACDYSEQNYDMVPGDSLTIVGPSEVTVPDTAEYYVRAFTIDKDYTWTVNGNPPDSTWREGEFIAVYFTDPGTYTISVQSSGQGDNYAGAIEVEAVPDDG